MRVFIFLALMVLSVPFVFAVELQTADTENLNDGYVRKDNGQGYGSDDHVRTYNGMASGGQWQRIYITFTTNVAGLTVNSLANAELILYNKLNDGGTRTLKLHEVYGIWNEDDIDWNNQPCGTTEDTAAGSCNSTAADSVSVSDTLPKKWDVTSVLRRALTEGYGNVSFLIMDSDEHAGSGAQKQYYSKEYTTDTTKRPILNITILDSQDPELSLYNVTSNGGEGCINWRTDKSNACSGSDSTPTITFTTDENAWCRIGITNSNYTDLGASRDCAGGQNSTSHTCTLTAQDASTGTFNISIGCTDALGNEDVVSSSGGLVYTGTNSEGSQRDRIEEAAGSALVTGYTIYNDQQVYIRNAANQQTTGVFDVVVKFANKVWAFNALNDADTAVGGFNITPVFYVLEIDQSGLEGINESVYNLIDGTK